MSEKLEQKDNSEVKTTSEEKSAHIEAIASKLHEDWQAEYAKGKTKEDGSIEQRIKTTKDEKWIKKMGTDQVDIANTSYGELPSDWQEEEKVSAEVAIELVYDYYASNGLGQVEDYPKWKEEASSKIHDAWLKRNGEWAPEEQKLPFDQLSEAEKEKDRKVLEIAEEIVAKNEGVVQSEEISKRKIEKSYELLGSLDGKSGKELDVTVREIFKKYPDFEPVIPLDYLETISKKTGIEMFTLVNMLDEVIDNRHGKKGTESRDYYESGRGKGTRSLKEDPSTRQQYHKTLNQYEEVYQQQEKDKGLMAKIRGTLKRL